MSITRKTGARMLLAIVTVLMMAISVIGFVPSVVKAEGEPASEPATFTLTGTKEQGSDGKYYPYLTISNYSKTVNNTATVILQKYDGSSWGDVGNKSYSKSPNGEKIGNSQISGIEFNVYYRIIITNDSNTDYSNVAIIEGQSSSSGSGEGGSGESGSGGSGSDDSGSGGSGSGTGSGSGSGSGSTTTEDKQANCPHNRGWIPSDKEGCRECYLCGLICDHSGNTNTEKKNEKYDYASEWEKGHIHKYSIECSICRGTLEYEDPIEAHDFTGSKAEYAGDDQHRKTCSKCGYNTLEKCDYEIKKSEYCKDSYFLDAASKGHNATKVCKICGNIEEVTSEEHTLVNGVCTVCGWKKVKPGKVSGIKVKITSKKTSKKTFTSKGHFDNLGRWVPSKTTHSSFKICKVKISFKKPKNGYQYKIEKTPGSGTTMSDSWVTKKTSGTYQMWFTGGT